MRLNFIQKIEKEALVKIIKIVLGSMLSIFLSEAIGLRYSIAAGIVTLLSVQDTRKETFKIAFARLYSFILALLIGILIYSAIGFHVVSFGLILLIYALIMQALSIPSHISIIAVLLSHFLLEKSVSIPLIENELLLLFIGAGVGILFNLYMPSRIGKIKEGQKKIENTIKIILKEIADALVAEEKGIEKPELFLKLEDELEEAIEDAYKNRKDALLGETRYYISYMDMRKNQKPVLQQIYKMVFVIQSVPIQSVLISEFVAAIQESFHECNNVVSLLVRLEELKKSFAEEELPATREEFESRALLFSILHELESFLAIKRDFVNQLTVEEKNLYWDAGKNS